MIDNLHRAKMPEPGNLAKRFDFALTKKTGVLRLPPAFWMNDPKINPRTDHLFWAALLLLDRSRIDMALSVLETELAGCVKGNYQEADRQLEQKVRHLIKRLLQHFTNSEQRRVFELELKEVIPEWMPYGDEDDG